MVVVAIFLIFLINVDVIGGKNIIFNRRRAQISYENEINPKADVGSENTIHAVTNSDKQYPTMLNNLRKQMEAQIETLLQDRSVQDTMAEVDPEMDPRETDSGLGQIRRLGPSDQLRQDAGTTRRRRKRSTTTTTTTTKPPTTRRRRTTTGPTTPTTTTDTPFTVKYLDDDTTTIPFIWTTSMDSLQRLLAKKLPFEDPAPDQIGFLPKGPMNPVTQPLWIFEEYDDRLSQSDVVKEDYKRCEAQLVRCTGATDYNQPVCVVDLTMNAKDIPLYARSKGFHSQCEVDYRNCLKRFEITGKFYAETDQEDYLQFLSYGWCSSCKLFGDSFCVASGS